MLALEALAIVHISPGLSPIRGTHHALMMVSAAYLNTRSPCAITSSSPSDDIANTMLRLANDFNWNEALSSRAKCATPHDDPVSSQFHIAPCYYGHQRSASVTSMKRPVREISKQSQPDFFEKNFAWRLHGINTVLTSRSSSKMHLTLSWLDTASTRHLFFLTPSYLSASSNCHFRFCTRGGQISVDISEIWKPNGAFPCIGFSSLAFKSSVKLSLRASWPFDRIIPNRWTPKFM